MICPLVKYPLPLEPDWYPSHNENWLDVIASMIGIFNCNVSEIVEEDGTALEILLPPRLAYIVGFEFGPEPPENKLL